MIQVYEGDRHDHFAPHPVSPSAEERAAFAMYASTYEANGADTEDVDVLRRFAGLGTYPTLGDHMRLNDMLTGRPAPPYITGELARRDRTGESPLHRVVEYNKRVWPEVKEVLDELDRCDL